MTTHRLHQITLQAVCATLLVLLLWSINPGSAQATIFKCVDSAGNTTYTGSPCEPEESSTRLSKAARTQPAMDCRVLQKLATETAQRMQAGESSADMIDSYGGMNTLSGVFMEMLSYIYTFNGNTSVTAERIAQLSTDRCRAGSFGPVGYDCAVYPPTFIEKLGGCDAAQNVSLTAAQSTDSDVTSDAAVPTLQSASPDAGVQPAGEEATSGRPASQDQRP